MNLYCSKCHTKWIEAYLNVGQKCPFKDCDGWLSAQKPVNPNPKPKPDPPTYPLLDVSEKP